MTPEERDNLHDLYRAAVLAVPTPPRMGRWSDAFKADKAFTDALYAIEVTE